MAERRREQGQYFPICLIIEPKTNKKKKVEVKKKKKKKKKL